MGGRPPPWTSICPGGCLKILQATRVSGAELSDLPGQLCYIQNITCINTRQINNCEYKRGLGQYVGIKKLAA